MTGALNKALQALAICIPVLVILLIVWSPALFLWQVWAVVIVGVAANMLQPSYRPFEGSRTPEDRGTAAQILWTVYLTQAAALTELVFRRRSDLTVDLITWAAVAAMIGGVALRTWAVVRLGPWFTWHITVTSGQELVTRGPYRLIRHPSYTGALIAFVATSVLLRSWLVAALACAALSVAFVRRIRYEEALLVEQLAGYDAYVRRTGALFPRCLCAASW